MSIGDSFAGLSSIFAVMGFAVVMATAATSSASVQGEGFCNLISAPYTISYPYFKRVGEAALLYVNPKRAAPGSGFEKPPADRPYSISWETAPVPFDIGDSSISFAWAVAVSGADNANIRKNKGIPLNMALYMDAPGVVSSRNVAAPLVKFNLGVPVEITWTGANPGVSLRFDALSRDEYDDLSGIMQLTLPRSMVEPGKSVVLRIEPEGTPAVKAFFMLFLDGDVTTFKSLWPNPAARMDNWRKYTEIHPFLTNFDASIYLHIADRSTADSVRRKAVEYIWPAGRLPTNKLPVVTEMMRPQPDQGGDGKWWRLPAFSGDQNLPANPGYTLKFVNAGLVSWIDWLEIPLGYDYANFAALIHPANRIPKPRLLIVHHGHGVAAPGEGIYEMTDLALKRGLTVLLMHMPLVGWNTNRTFRLPDGKVAAIEGTGVEGHNRLVAAVEGIGGSALRYFIEPVIVGINHFLACNPGTSDVAMVGLSGGGWTTQVAAALDDRIKLSVGVAGSYPLYLRRLYRGAEGDAEQELPALYVERASWLDLYVLAGYGNGRLAIQILNQFDPYFYGLGHLTYSGLLSRTVKLLGAGEWRCILDSSHKNHIISPWAIREVIAPSLGMNDE